MIHNSLLKAGPHVKYTYAIGGEYYRLPEPADFDAFVRKLTSCMEIPDDRQEGVMQTYFLCIERALEARESFEEMISPDSRSFLTESMVNHAQSKCITYNELATLMDFAIFVTWTFTCWVNGSGLRTDEDGCPSTFVYQNNNTGETVAWIHLNDCSSRSENPFV